MERIRKKEAEIQTLEEKLKAAKVYVQALNDVLGLLEPGDTHITACSDASSLRPRSAMALAREAIIRAGRPMHVDELLKASGKELTREARTSLGSALSSYVRRGEIFTRPATSTFGLREMRHFPEHEPSLLAEPPPGFGGFPKDLRANHSD